MCLILQRLRPQPCCRGIRLVLYTPSGLPSPQGPSMAQEQSPLLQCKRDCVLRIEDKVASVCYSNQGLGCEIVPIQIGVLKHSLLTLWAGVRIRYLLLGDRTGVTRDLGLPKDTFKFHNRGLLSLQVLQWVTIFLCFVNYNLGEY